MTFPDRLDPRKVLYRPQLPGSVMKDPVEVLRRKEAELERLQEEVDALRLAGRLLKEKTSSGVELQARGKVLQMP